MNSITLGFELASEPGYPVIYAEPAHAQNPYRQLDGIVVVGDLGAELAVRVLADPQQGSPKLLNSRRLLPHGRDPLGAVVRKANHELAGANGSRR